MFYTVTEASDDEVCVVVVFEKTNKARLRESDQGELQDVGSVGVSELNPGGCCGIEPSCTSKFDWKIDFTQYV